MAQETETQAMARKMREMLAARRGFGASASAAETPAAAPSAKQQHREPQHHQDEMPLEQTRRKPAPARPQESGPSEHTASRPSGRHARMGSHNPCTTTHALPHTRMHALPSPSDRFSAASSHQMNDQYMENFDRAWEEMQRMNVGNSFQVSSSSSPSPPAPPQAA